MALTIKGINYDVGTEYLPGRPSRTLWTETDIVRDMRVIAEELHCNSVNLYGSDIARLVEGAEVALRQGLATSIQPRLIDGDRGQMVAFLERGAREAERLRRHGEVTLNTGCEISLFTSGFLPGRTFRSRMRNLIWSWPLLPLANRRLSSHLREVARIARAAFGGPITYGAGVWENVDWDPFDLVGVNLYRDKENERTYTADLRGLKRHGKPVVITEFGCCTFDGAERVGGAGWLIVDYDRDPPALKPGHRRSERAQADLVGELLDLYIAEGIHGAYVFDFMESSHRHDPEAERDLDMASYGIVKVMPARSGEISLEWRRKEAFEAVAARYGV